MRTWFWVLGLMACTRAAQPIATVAIPSATVSAASATPVPVHPLASKDRELAHGVIVDLAAHREVRTLLTDDDVWNDAEDGVQAYEHIRADNIKRFKEEVRSYDMATGRLLWTQEVARCYAMVAAPAGAFCDGDAYEIVLLDRATGKPRTLVANGLFGITRLERMGSKVAAIGASGTAVFYDAATGAPAGSLKLPGNLQMARATNDIVCGVSFDSATGTLTCFDASPRIVRTRAIAITRGFLRMSDEHDALFTSQPFSTLGQSPSESIIVSLDDGHEVARIHQMASCFVRREDGRLEGFFQQTPWRAFLDMTGRERWQTTELSGDSASVVIVGDALVVASYGRISSGAELMAFDSATGATRWRGAVELFPISHSVYSNEVDLRVVGGAIIMRGREAMQDYLEIFEPRAGKRLYSTVRYR